MKNQKTSIKGIIGTIILLGIIAIVGVSIFSPGEKETAAVAVEKTIEPFYTFESRTSELHTPKNYALDYLRFWHLKNWEAMAEVSNNWTADRLKSQLEYTELKGYKYINSTKTKTTAELQFAITYYDHATETDKVKIVKASLFLADDYVTWLVNPYTLL